jgi:hypothetical protein
MKVLRGAARIGDAAGFHREIIGFLIFCGDLAPNGAHHIAL